MVRAVVPLAGESRSQKQKVSAVLVTIRDTLPHEQLRIFSISNKVGDRVSPCQGAPVEQPKSPGVHLA